MRHGGDRRGSAKSRRSRKVWLLDTYGDGTHAPCAHCDVPLDYSAVEADRIEPGGSYKRDNVQPACRRCNAQRSNNLSWIPATIPQDNPNQQETELIMADRKEAPPEPGPTVYNMGLTEEDVQLNRLRVVGKLAAHADADKFPHPTIEGRALAVPGDIAVGPSAEADADDMTIIPRPGTVKFYVVAPPMVDYNTKFGGTEGGPWAEGDPEMPADAKRQFNYMLFIPAVDERFPVKYTASSSAASEARGMNTKLVVSGMNGRAPYEFAWEMTTKTNTKGTNSWPGPVFKLAEPDPDEVAQAKAMHDSIMQSRNAALKQLTSGDDTDAPPEF